MNPSYTLKSAARALAQLTDQPYQRCLDAVRARNLNLLLPTPAPLDDVVDTAAAALAVGGQFPTPREAAVALLSGTVAAIVRTHYPDAASALVEMDEEAPLAGWLRAVTLADGTEVEDVFAEPVSDECWVWANLLAHTWGLLAGECREVPVA